MVCTHRDFSKSWIGIRNYSQDNYIEMYNVALYFVTTTLSTCGFGDIYATHQDVVENMFVLILQFVGLLFYSYTINEV